MSNTEGTPPCPLPNSVPRDSSEFNAVDAVHWFNTKIDIALEKQRRSIVSELQEKLKSNTDFKGEGNKIQFAFNEDRLRGLDTLKNFILLGDIKEALDFIDSEKKALGYRN